MSRTNASNELIEEYLQHTSTATYVKWLIAILMGLIIWGIFCPESKLFHVLGNIGEFLTSIAVLFAGIQISNEFKKQNYERDKALMEDIEELHNLFNNLISSHNPMGPNMVHPVENKLEIIAYLIDKNYYSYSVAKMSSKGFIEISEFIRNSFMGTDQEVWLKAETYQPVERLITRLKKEKS